MPRTEAGKRAEAATRTLADAYWPDAATAARMAAAIDAIAIDTIEAEAVAAERARIRAAVEGLAEDEVMYDHPVAMSGEPMDPDPFVRLAAVLAIIDREATDA